MSTEQLENIEQLGRRAVACKHWRWMPGMACQWNHPRSGAGGQQVMPTWARVVDHPMGPFPLTYCIVDVYSVYRFAYPDLTDPATLGCLLALVRGAWDSPSAYAMPWGISPQSGTPGGWSMMITPDDTLPTAKLSAPTEAAALIAALEVAP